MKKALCVIFAFLLCISTFSACGKKDTSGKTFAVACYSMPETYDPQIAASEIEKTTALNCFDTLLRPDENGTMQCLAAESYSVSPDGLVYTVKIRDGLKYFVPSKTQAFIEEKGGTVPTSVTAYDFAFGILRAVLPETKAADYKMLASIKNADAVHSGAAAPSELGVEATDAKTLVITLCRPDPNFTFALSQAVCAPCNEQFFDLTGGRYGKEIKYTVFSGGFYVSNDSAEASFTISKNPEYGGIFEAVPSSVTFYLNSDTSSVAGKLKKGTYDCAFIGSADLKKLGGKESKQALTDITYCIVFNFSQERFKNTDLRRGLVGSADFSVTENKADGIVAPNYRIAGEKAVNSGVSKVEFNVDNARKYLKNAMTQEGLSKLKVDILCTAETEAIAKKIVSSWQKNVGVELSGTVLVAETDDFYANIAKKDFDIAVYPISSPSCDGVTLLSAFTGENFAGYSSEEFDRIFNDLSSDPTAEKLTYAQSFLIENAVAVPIYFDSEYFICKKGVSGIYFTHDKANIYFYKGRK